MVSTHSERMKALLDDLKKEYKFVVIDSPPLTLVHDSTILAKLVDCVLVVVNSNRVDKEMLLNCKNLLEQAGAHVIGAVLNHVEPIGIYKSNKYYHAKN